MMLYKNKKEIVHSPDSNAGFLDVDTGVLQKDTLASLIFIICLDYVQQTKIDLMKEYDFT